MKRIVVKGLLGSFLLLLSLGFSFINYAENNYNIREKKVSVKYVKINKIETKEKAELAVADDLVNNTSEVIQNSDILSNSIKVSNALETPLMKDSDGSNFYIDHNIYGVYDGRGVPYIDFRNDFSTRKTIIYAHSMVNGNGPFQGLQKYHNNKDYYEANRFITINYEGNTYNYEIFSVYVSLADSEESEGLEYFHRMIYTNSEWNDTIQKYKANSEYETGVTVNSSDKIIILQTCSMDPNYYGQYYRYNLLIMGKLV